MSLASALPSIIIYLGTLITVVCGSLIAYYSGDSTKQQFIRKASIASIIAGILAASCVFIDSNNNANAQRVMQDSINRTKTLGEINNELGEKIKSLQVLNNTIATNTGVLVIKNKDLTEKSVQLNETIKPVVVSTKLLSSKMNVVMDEMKREQLGFGSIPIVSVRIDDFRWKHDASFENWSPDLISFKNNYSATFHVKNYGRYTLPKIEITANNNDEYGTGEMVFNRLVYGLSANENLDIGIRVKIDTMRVIQTASYQYPYFTMKVQWKGFEYLYGKEVIYQNNLISFSDIYIFDQKPYFTIEDFINAFKKKYPGEFK